MKTRIQYCHDRGYSLRHPLSLEFLVEPKGGRTIAVEVPTNEEFDALNGHLTLPIPVPVGIAVCSKKDLYNKKVGRQYALSRLKESLFLVVDEFHPSVPGEPRIIHLYSIEHDLIIQLTKYPNTNRVYFEGVV